MTTRYANAWAAQATQWYGEQERFTVSNTATDPAHGDKSEAPAPLMMDAPVLPAGGEIYSDVHWEETPNPVQIDRTPVRGHGTPQDSGHGFGGNFRIGASDAQLAAHRGVDLGADKRETSSPPVYWFHDDHPYTTHTVGFEPPPIAQMHNNPALIRGINGYAANDGPAGRLASWSVEGESWRRGDYYQENIARGAFHPPLRHHREIKMVEPDYPTIIADAPPPDKPDTYASPFSSLQTFMPRFRRPFGTRREPGPWDEQLNAQEVTEGATNYADGLQVP